MECLKCSPVHKDWLFLAWVGPDDCRVKSRRELIEIEKLILKKSLRGWIAESGKNYKKMHNVLLKLGAKIYAEDDESFYFMKEISNGKIG